MASQKQLDANRSNAQHATGPRTPAGKHRAAQNAATHQAFCRHLVLDGEDERRFQALRRPYLASLNPQTVAELFLADRAVSLAWRLDRLQAAEHAAYDLRREDLLDKIHRLDPDHDDHDLGDNPAADNDADADADDNDEYKNDTAARAATLRARLGDLDPAALIDAPFVLADAYAHPDADNPFERLARAEQRLHGMLNTTLRRLESLQRHRARQQADPTATPTCPFLDPDEPADDADPAVAPAPTEELQNEPNPNPHSPSVPSVSSVFSPPPGHAHGPNLQNKPKPKAARALFQAVTTAAGDLLPPRRTP